jgi:modulator of FtsH protease HflC
MKKSHLLIVLLILAVALLIQQSFFIVDEMEHAVVTFFGQPVKIYRDEPGLKRKIPFVHAVNRMDDRVHLYEGQEAEYLTLDKINIIVTFYTLWRVDEPLVYLKTVRERYNAEAILEKIIRSNFGTAFSEVDFKNLIHTDPEKMQLSQLVDRVFESARKNTFQEYGIDLVDLRIKRISFPEQVKESVFKRIQEERRAKSAEERAAGRAEAQEIRSEADRVAAGILTEAREKATIRIGKGEATAARIWRETLEQNLDFYQFLKTLEIYEEGIREDTTWYVPSDSPLLRLLMEGPQEAPSLPGIPENPRQGERDTP